MIKLKLSSKILIFGKLAFASESLMTSEYFKFFLMRLIVILINVIFKILHNRMFDCLSHLILWLVHDATKSCMIERSIPKGKIDQRVLCNRAWKLYWSGLNSTLQVTLKNILLLKFWYTTNEEYPWLSEKTIKILLPFQTVWYWILFASVKITGINRLNVHALMRIQLFCLKPDIKEICNHAK